MMNALQAAVSAAAIATVDVATLPAPASVSSGGSEPCSQIWSMTHRVRSAG